MNDLKGNPGEMVKELQSPAVHLAAYREGGLRIIRIPGICFDERLGSWAKIGCGRTFNRRIPGILWNCGSSGCAEKKENQTCVIL